MKGIEKRSLKIRCSCLFVCLFVCFPPLRAAHGVDNGPHVIVELWSFYFSSLGQISIHLSLLLWRFSVTLIVALCISYLNLNAAQGPLKDTAGHFWLMVWEQNSRAVVMLNRIIEKEQVDCFVVLIDILYICVSNCSLKDGVCTFYLFKLFCKRLINNLTTIVCL